MESFLVVAAEVGWHSSSFLIHKVTIAPLEQEWHWDVSLWGYLFNFTIISGTMSPEGFGFGTRREGKGDGYHLCIFLLHLFQQTMLTYRHPASVPASPIKMSSPLKSVSSPLLKVSAQSMYLASKSFDDPSKTSLKKLSAVLTIDCSVQYQYMMAGKGRGGLVFSSLIWTLPTFSCKHCTALPHVRSPWAQLSLLVILSLHILVTWAPFFLLIFSLSYF